MYACSRSFCDNKFQLVILEVESYLRKPKFHPDWFFKLFFALGSGDDIHNASSYLLIATVEKIAINMLVPLKRSVFTR